jgi:hypothetical protein
MIRLPKYVVVVLALAFVMGLAVPALAADEVAKGKIKGVDADKNEFVLTDQNGKDWTFQMDKEAKVRIANQPSKLADLKPNTEAEVTYVKQGVRLIAKEIRCDKK